MSLFLERGKLLIYLFLERGKLLLCLFLAKGKLRCLLVCVAGVESVDVVSCVETRAERFRLTVP